MKIAGMTIIGLAALIEIVFGTLVLLDVVDDNPVGTVAMLSAASFALGGALLWFVRSSWENRQRDGNSDSN